MTRRWKTAWALLALTALAVTGAGAAHAHTPSVERPAASGTSKPRAAAGTIVFPVIGKARYEDDYGDPRGQGGHEGNDIITDWRTPAVAAEAGKVKYWTSSSRAGCMLYLYGASGTTYLYIHLNNDLTPRHDDRGRCEQGTAYAVPDGATVSAGEVIGWNGDSGDAEGNYHLHFEVHPGGKGSVNPFPYLNAARRLLFPGKAGAPFSLGLRGKPVAAGNEQLTVAVTQVRWWPGGKWTTIEPRTVTVAVPQEAALDRPILDAVTSPVVRQLSSRTAGDVTVFTLRGTITPEAQAGEPGTLVAARVVGGA